MFLLDSNEVLEHLSNIIHKDTQQHKRSVDLTVSQIHQFTKAGSLDFGGSEFEAAKSKVIDPVKQSKNDDYGWWILKEGSHKAVFNESLQKIEDSLIAIAPHSHALDAGLVANTQLFSIDDNAGTLSMNFHVPKNGCNIKENARFATLYILAE